MQPTLGSESDYVDDVFSATPVTDSAVPTTIASTQDAVNQTALQRLCGRMNWLNFSSMLPHVPFALLRDLHLAVSADKEKSSVKLF